MPNRIIKESICTSEEIASISPEAEVLFYRLIVKADDFGLFHGNPKIIIGNCFPLSSPKESKVQSWLDELCRAGLIVMYIADDGKKYLKLLSWDKHQQRRATKSKFPHPVLSDITCEQMKSDDITCEQIKSDTIPSDDINCNQLYADDITCNQLHAIVPVNENVNENVNEKRETKTECLHGAIKPIAPCRPAATAPTVICLALNDKSEYPITEQQTQQWAELFPAVDILQELRKMKGWLDANPTKRKTKKGILRFVNTWLSKEQDKGGVRNKTPAAKKNYDTGDDFLGGSGYG